MSLPILQNHPAASNEDLLRFYHRTELHWARHIGEETTLDVGTAITNPQLPQVHDANRMLDMFLPEGMSPADAVRQVGEHFAQQGAHCARWVLAPGESNRTAPLREYLLAQGCRQGGPDILHLAGQPAGAIREVGDLTIIPARASFRHMRQLADEWAAHWNAPQLADAAMLHLDDPHVDALLALRRGAAAGYIAVLAVGEIGCIEDVFVSAPFRGQGIGTTMMSRAMEICARSLFKHVFIGVDPSNAVARSLYERFGFAKIGSYISFQSRDASC